MVRATTRHTLGVAAATLIGLFPAMGRDDAEKEANLSHARRLLRKCGGGVALVPGKLHAARIVLVCLSPTFFGDLHRNGVAMGKLRSFFARTDLITPDLWTVLAIKTNDARRLDAFDTVHPDFRTPLIDAAGVCAGHATTHLDFATFYAPLFFNGKSLGELTLQELKAWGHGTVLGAGGPWADERKAAGLLPASLEGILVDGKETSFRSNGKSSGATITSHAVDRKAEAVNMHMYYRAFFKGEPIDDVANFHEGLLDHFVQVDGNPVLKAGTQAQTFKKTKEEYAAGRGGGQQKTEEQNAMNSFRQSNKGVSIADAFTQIYGSLPHTFAADAHAAAVAAAAALPAPPPRERPAAAARLPAPRRARRAAAGANAAPPPPPSDAVDDLADLDHGDDDLLPPGFDFTLPPSAALVAAAEAAASHANLAAAVASVERQLAAFLASIPASAHGTMFVTERVSRLRGRVDDLLDRARPPADITLTPGAVAYWVDPALAAMASDWPPLAGGGGGGGGDGGGGDGGGGDAGPQEEPPAVTAELADLRLLTRYAILSYPPAAAASLGLAPLEGEADAALRAYLEGLVAATPAGFGPDGMVEGLDAGACVAAGMAFAHPHVSPYVALLARRGRTMARLDAWFSPEAEAAIDTHLPPAAAVLDGWVAVLLQANEAGAARRATLFAALSQQHLEQVMSVAEALLCRRAQAARAHAAAAKLEALAAKVGRAAAAEDEEMKSFYAAAVTGACALASTCDKATAMATEAYAAAELGLEVDAALGVDDPGGHAWGGGEEGGGGPTPAVLPELCRLFPHPPRTADPRFQPGWVYAPLSAQPEALPPPANDAQAEAREWFETVEDLARWEAARPHARPPPPPADADATLLEYGRRLVEHDAREAARAGADAAACAALDARAVLVDSLLAAGAGGGGGGAAAAAAAAAAGQGDDADTAAAIASFAAEPAIVEAAAAGGIPPEFLARARVAHPLPPPSAWPHGPDSDDDMDERTGGHFDTYEHMAAMEYRGQLAAGAARVVDAVWAAVERSFGTDFAAMQAYAERLGVEWGRARRAAGDAGLLTAFAIGFADVDAAAAAARAAAGETEEQEVEETGGTLVTLPDGSTVLEL